MRVKIIEKVGGDYPLNDLTKLSLADLKRRLQTLEEEREELEEEKN